MVSLLEMNFVFGYFQKKVENRVETPSATQLSKLDDVSCENGIG